MEFLNTIISFISSMLVFGTPIILAGLGGVMCENAGVVNIALEGIMRFGGFFAVFGSYISSRVIDPITGMRNPLGGNPWIGILFAISVGILAGLLHGYISISLKGNQIVSAVAINVFSLGGMTFFLERYFNTTGHSPSVASFMGKPLFPALTRIPVLGDLFKTMNIFVWLAVILPFVVHFYLYHTHWGLRHRAVGEHPKAADTLGINVYGVRYFAVIMSGVFAAIAGASMSIGQLDLFDNHMPAGLGFIGLAAMIFGKWKPLGTFLAALFFTLANVMQIYIQTHFPQILKIIPRGFFLALPYILTILILAGFVGRATPPAADGVPMKKAKSCKDSIIFSDEFKGSFYPHTCLETTLISFGFPYPDNLKIAKKLEDLIRKEEVIPITIGIREGKILVGLKEEDLEYFAKSKDILKANMRDVPYLLSTMKSGALTISGMLHVMDHFGLKFLASGGLGGVHIGFEEYFDISADLFALSKFKSVVVTSGFKSILDIKRSWEFLETLGVPVVGFNTDKLPGFYYKETDIPLDNYFYKIEDLINYIDFWDRFYNSSLLIVNPIPDDDEIDRKDFEGMLNSILDDAKNKRIEGKNVTPFILSELHKKSQGKTIKANKSLLINNAKLCAKISKLYFEK